MSAAVVSGGNADGAIVRCPVHHKVFAVAASCADCDELVQRRLRDADCARSSTQRPVLYDERPRLVARERPGDAIRPEVHQYARLVAMTVMAGSRPGCSTDRRRHRVRAFVVAATAASRSCTTSARAKPSPPIKVPGGK